MSCSVAFPWEFRSTDGVKFADLLGRPLGYLICSLIALIVDPIYQHFSEGFRGQPSLASLPMM